MFHDLVAVAVQHASDLQAVASSVSATHDWHVLTSYGANGQTLITGSLAEKYLDIPNTIMLAICTALVLLMVPGLAIFYAGLVRRKNVSTILLQTMAPMLITGLIWFLFGFSLAFGSATPGGFIGNIGNYALLRNVIFANGFSGGPTLVVNTTLCAGVPFILYFLFQGAFAIITPALVVGAFADRLSWKGFIFFNVMFTLFVYIPVCNWIFGGGFLAQAGTIDWAGGIVIHTTCGAAAVAAVIVMRRRVILKKESTKPHSIPLVVIGGALLFFGWFGFNTGGGTYIPLGGAVPGQATNVANTTFVFNGPNVQTEATNYFFTAGVSAFSNTAIATIFGILIYVVFDWAFDGKPTTVGAITGGVAGLATITPTAGFIPIWASVIVGITGAVVTYACCKFNHAIHFDDALEVWPVHGIGGVVGAMLVGGFASIAVNPTIAEMNGTATTDAYKGVVFGNTQLGSGTLFGMEVGAIVLTIGWTMFFMLLTFMIIKYLFKDGFLTAEQQIEGADEVVTGEEAYAPVYNVEPILLGEGNEVEDPHHDAHDHSTQECVEILSDKVDKAVFARNADRDVSEITAEG